MGILFKLLKLLLFKKVVNVVLVGVNNVRVVL